MKASYFFLLCAFSISAGAIIHGEPCTEDQFPASLALIELEHDGYEQTCGATLIARDIAVTAAHCIQGFFEPSYPLKKTLYFVTSKEKNGDRWLVYLDARKGEAKGSGGLFLLEPFEPSVDVTDLM